MGEYLNRAERMITEEEDMNKAIAIRDLLLEKKSKEKRIKAIDAKIVEIEKSDWDVKYATE